MPGCVERWQSLCGFDRDPRVLDKVCNVVFALLAVACGLGFRGLSGVCDVDFFRPRRHTVFTVCPSRPIFQGAKKCSTLVDMN